MNFRPGVLAMVLCACNVHAQQQIDHGLFDAVLKEHVVAGVVDYRSVKKDQRFAEYLRMLRAVDPSRMTTREDRLAFWINAYNAFTIQLVLEHFPVNSIRDITEGEKGPWSIPFVSIGGYMYTLDMIEHEVIRKRFDEPRIHMALVCAAISCPPLRSEAYSGATLDAQLEANTMRFLRDTTKNRYNASTNTLYLSELFEWFGGDFEIQYGSAVNFVVRKLGLHPPSTPQVRYLPYDWSLNTQHG